MHPLRPLQANALHLLNDSFRSGHKRPLIMAPTGFGKTNLAAHMISNSLKKGNPIGFVVPAVELINQTVDVLHKSGIEDIGVIQADHPLTDRDKPVQVASIQTVARRRTSYLPKMNSVLVDEAHIVFKSMIKWMGEWSAIPFVGLSATPWTRGLGKHYDDLIVAATTKQLIEDGYLAPFRVFSPDHPDVSGVRTRAGDFALEEISEVMQDSLLVSDIVKNWIEHGENRSTLCFCVDRAHAKKVQQEFLDSGVPCGYIDAYTEPADRKLLAKAFASGKIRVVANVGVLTTGIDWDVGCIIMARPTKSEILFVQIIGRGLRVSRFWDDCLIFDHSDTHLRLGFVTDIHHTELNHGERQPNVPRVEDDALPSECPECHFLKPPRISTCPACGYKPQRQSRITPAQGELIELDGQTKAQKANCQKFSDDEKGEFYSGLATYGLGKDYSDKWAAVQYKEKFGMWPPPSIRAYPAVPCRGAAQKWVKYINIRNARRRA